MLEPYRSTDATAGPYGMYILAVVLLVGGLLVYLWGHVNTMAQGQEMDRLRVERKALIQQQSHLKARLAGLKHSSRIREIAVQKLGMGFPEGPPRNLYLEPQPGTKGVN